MILPKDPNDLLDNVSSVRGAPMGRMRIRDNTKAKVRLFCVRFYDYAYDKGGAYWGMGTPLYAAIGEGFQEFRRAHSRKEMKDWLKKEYPDLQVR